MTESPFEQDAPVSGYGAWRKQQSRRHAEGLAAMAQEAELAAYAQSEERQVTQSGQVGISGDHMTAYQRAELFHGQPATVGAEYGQARPLQRLGAPSAMPTKGQHLTVLTFAAPQPRRASLGQRILWTRSTEGSGNGDQIQQQG